MKLKSLLTLVASLAIGFNVALAADDDTPLAKEMKAMNKSLRALKKQAADAAKKDDNLTLIAGIKTHLDAAAKLEPAKTKDIPAAQKAAYIEKYKKEIAELEKTYDDLAAAIKDGKADDAKKALDKIGDEKEQGHKDFYPDENN
jgi:putative salt-induced outer membrane protein YdiY